MSVENKIRDATCRVDSRGSQLGSAFWVDSNLLLTAAHVVEASPDETVSIRTVDGESFQADIVKKDVNTDQNSGSDLALLEADVPPEDYEVLPMNTEIPSIGTEVLWSGYARLVGEPKIDRQRFGWGRVASTEYGEGEGSFFEVDGLFNPSHSGGPVIDNASGNVVGVVSASAGGFGDVEQKWTEQITQLQELFKLQSSSDGMLFRTYEYEDPGRGIQAKTVFQSMGLNVDSDVDDDGNIHLQINTEEIPLAAGKIQAELAKLLLDTSQATFQMGVGIASGGSFLKEFIR
ncbi:S1 family peptidase [Halobellus limi]|nr:serine protease [Halobellus limi]